MLSLHSSTVWVMLELALLTLAGKGRKQPWSWHHPQGELFLTPGITETALKNWQNQLLALQDDEDASSGAVEGKL